MSEIETAKYSELENRLEYVFTNKGNLQQALIHSSYAHENNIKCSNERLELLGDAVLHLALTEFLMEKYENDSEGQLSALRSYCESEAFLYERALKLHLGKYIKFGKGEELSGGQYKKSLLANTFEAVIAAIHIDGGYKKARQFILQQLQSDVLDVHDKELHIDSKSELQKLTQKHYNALPVYTVISESGLDHDKIFEVKVTVSGGEEIIEALGYGRNKKAAEKDAARAVLGIINQ